MVLEVVVAVAVAAFAAHVLVPAVRNRVEFEIEMGTALVCLWSSAYLLWIGAGAASRDAALPGWVRAGGLVLWILSVLLFALAVFFLRTRGEPERGWEETTVLSTGGLHALVRHPIELAAVLAAVGIALMGPSPVVVTLCLASAVLAARAAFAEDGYNVAKFGDAYREYMRTVPRLNLVLGIWRRVSSRARPRR